MVSSCDVLTTEGDDLYIVVQGDGQALQPDGTFGHHAQTYNTVEGARAAARGMGRVLFTFQWRKFKLCGCLK